MSKKIIKFQTEDGSSTYLIKEFKETYHSRHGAITESQFVYLKEGFNFWNKKFVDKKCNILELGYGTGLNAYLSFLEANKLSKQVDYVSLEPFPLTIKEIELLKYANNFEYSSSFMTFDKFSKLPWELTQKISLNHNLIKIKKRFEDFKSQKLFDLIYYDAFGYNAQPELWEEWLMKKCYNLLNSGGVWVSYCAKGTVRRGLEEAGFNVYRLPGPPGKREMLRAIKE
tara:strand:+ start:4040 stop:4720 length:681 start_codon:yes stop_codon:yes gene_type:complete